MKIHTEYLVFETKKRREMVHITDQVEQIVKRSGVKDGLCFVSPMHITAAVWINDDEPGILPILKTRHDIRGPNTRA